MTIGKTTVKIDEIFKSAKTSSADFTETVINLGKELGTLPTVAQKAVTTFSSFEKITLPNDEIQNFATSFVDLSEAEKKAALNFISFENASQKDKFNARVSDLSSGTALNSSLFQQELATKSLDEQTQKLILTEAGLIDSHGKYNIIAEAQAQTNIKASQTFNTLSDTQKAEVLAAEADVAAKQAQKATNTGLIASNGALAISFEVVKKAMIGIGIGVAITAITAVVSAGIKELNEYVDSLDTYKTAVKNAEEASSAFKEEQSNLESYRNEIKENTKQILALEEAKKNASKEETTSDEEIAKLRNQNSLLQANIRLHEIQAKKEAKKANDNALEALKAQNYNTHLAEPQYTSEFSDGLHDTVSDMTAEEYLKSQIAQWYQLNDELTEAHKNYSALRHPTEEQTAAFEEQTAQIKEQMATLDDNITNVGSDLTEIFSNIADDGSEKFDDLSKRSGECSDMLNKWDDAAHGASEAADEVNNSVKNAAETFDKINPEIDGIQSAYKSLNSAVQEYNTYGGISLDTLQEILALDDKYVNCLVDQNGQLSLNMNTFQELAKMRLQEAEAAAVQQAIQELNNVTAEDEVETSEAVCGAIGDKINILALLGEQYGNLTGCMIAAHDAEELFTGYHNASLKNAAKADEIMSALDKKLGLIHNTLNSVSGSVKGAANALGGFSDSNHDVISSMVFVKLAIIKFKLSMTDRNNSGLFALITVRFRNGISSVVFRLRYSSIS